MENKVNFLTRRIQSRMVQLDLRSVRDYIRYLSFDWSGNEMEELINLIVTCETYFFRDYDQLRVMAEEVLPIVVKEKGNAKKLAVLSAGCSTGDESYTAAIILREMLDGVNAWSLRIDGIDISKKLLNMAREGVYRDHALRETPYLYRDRYFGRQDNLYLLNPEIKEMVTFMRVNLYDRRQVSILPAYDIVFCRNVLIYFDRESAGRVMEYLYDIMNPGAFLFLGHAEAAGKSTSLFKMVRFGRSFVYQK